MLDHFPNGDQNEHLDCDDAEMPPIRPLEKWIGFIIAFLAILVISKAYLNDGL